MASLARQTCKVFLFVHGNSLLLPILLVFMVLWNYLSWWSFYSILFSFFFWGGGGGVTVRHVWLILKFFNPLNICDSHSFSCVKKNCRFHFLAFGQIFLVFWNCKNPSRWRLSGVLATYAACIAQFSLPLSFLPTKFSTKLGWFKNTQATAASNLIILPTLPQKVFYQVHLKTASYVWQ